MSNSKLVVNKTAFLKWYFEESPNETFLSDFNVQKKLESESEKFELSLVDLVRSCGYLPSKVVVSAELGDHEIELCPANFYSIQII